MLYLKFGDCDEPNLCRVKKVDVSSTFIEHIFRSGLTLVSSWDCFCHNSCKPLTYSDNQKPMEYEDDIIAVFKCIWWCYKANSFTKNLKLICVCVTGLFTLHNCCVS